LPKISLSKVTLGQNRGMRILYIINGFDPGGAEHGLLTLIENGAFDGHDLLVLALCRGRGTLADKIVANLDSNKVLFVSQKEQLTIKACVLGVIQAISVFRSFRPQKVVLSLKQANIVGRLAAIVNPGVTCAAFEHIAEYRARRLNWLYGFLLYALSWRVNEVWADCVETLVRTRRYFVNRKRNEFVIPLFIADENRLYKSNYDIGEEVHLASAGRLIKRKNISMMIDVVKSLRDRGMNVSLDIFGAGPEQDSLDQKIDHLNLREIVRINGYRKDWIDELIKADIFLNFSDMEGFCIVVAEAMMVGMPVIAIGVGGIQDYGRDEHNMLKLLTPDIKVAEEAIVRLINDETIRETLGQNARADMLAKYGVENMKHLMGEALS